VKLLDEVKEWVEAPTGVICAATALLIASHYQGSTGWFSGHLADSVGASSAHDALPYFWWFGASVFLYLLCPLALSWVSGMPRTNRFGFGLGDLRLGLKWTALLLAVMLPVVYLATWTPAFQGAYPLAGAGAYQLKPPGGPAHSSWPLFAAYEAAYLAYFVAWEFFFRGWLLQALAPALGRRAVLVQMIPFALLHLGKPEPEAFGSVVAGLALGALALRTRSFWYGAIIHGGVAVWMDILSVPRLG